MTEISFKNVTKVYEGTKIAAISDVNFEVEKGEFFCIVGPSGCGKSTILKLIGNIEEPTKGEINKPKEISMVFQSGALLPWLTVEENISLVAKIKGFKNEKLKQQTKKYLQMVELTEFKFKYPRDLSGGQRQRVGIARALAVEPEVLLLDEPFSALDPVTTDELHKYLQKIWNQTNKTVVMVSHSIEEAIKLSDKIMIMKQGGIKEIIKIILKRPRETESKEFIQFAQQIKLLLESN